VCRLFFGALVPDVLAAADGAAASGRVETVFSSYPAR
jgi:hypothetical protein